MRKRFGIIIAAILALAMAMPAAAQADGAPGAGSTAGLLTIDNKNVYAGMSKSYAAGYMPTHSGSKVRIVLPLLAGAPIAGDTVTVTPNLGTPGSSPFVFGNYIETVKLAPHPVNTGAASVSAYLADLSLPLASGRMRGTYPVLLTVDYKDGSGTDMEQTFTLYVTVNGKDPNATPPAPTPEPVRHQPKVIVSKYSVSPDPVVAGKDFTLEFTLKNTSDSYAVSNIQVTVKSGADLYPADNTNTLYYKGIAKGKTLNVSIPMRAKEDATTDPHSVSVTVEYEDARATGFTESSDIPVTVTQSLCLTYDAPNAPASMTAGDTAPFTLQVMNKGRSKVYNVTCALQAPGLLPQASAFLGDMDPGTAKPAQIMVFAGSLDMTADGASPAPLGGASGFGMTSGAITITYEDEFGKQYTDTVKTGTTIEAPVMPSAPAETPAQPKASQWWISVLIAAALIAAVAVFLALSRRSRERKVRPHDEA